MTDEPTTAAADTLAFFVVGKDVPHHVSRVVLDFIPRIQREARREGAAEVLAAVERLRRPSDDWPIDPPGLGGTWDLGYRSGWADAVDDAIDVLEEAERKKAAETA